MSLLRPIPKELREITNDPVKSKELLGILSVGKGELTTADGRKFVFRPAFNGSISKVHDLNGKRAR